MAFDVYKGAPTRQADEQSRRGRRSKNGGQPKSMEETLDMPRDKKATYNFNHDEAIAQYEHTAERLNNPPVGLVTPGTDPDAGKKKYACDPHIDPALLFDSQRAQIERLIESGLEATDLADAKAVLSELKNRQRPYLNWAGKAERTSFEVPVVSLHVHERIEPHTIIDTVRRREEKGPEQLTIFHFFDQPKENPPLRQAVEFYKHKHNWSNRLIAGDSLLVMNSLLEKEGMAGQVQMVYIDPPYGIKYGSNFQPFVTQRDVKDGKDEDLTVEPEMVRAFRDTWELGIHSYLTYLRDRMLLAREVLTDSGSCFVQIGDENAHLVQCLMDEVFGKENFISLIPFRKKTMPFGTIYLEQMSDILIWYGKTKFISNGSPNTKFRKLFINQNVEGEFHHCWYELPDGTRHRMKSEQLYNHKLLPQGARVYRLKSLEPSGPMASGMFEYEFEGKIYTHPKNGYGTSPEGMDRLKNLRRLQPEGNRLTYVLYADENPATRLTAPWADTVGADDKRYVVQTNTEVVRRCILMTTDPGDVVLDPTCGSGTTAYVAEQWGRRWITCDTSRVAITLAKQRLMTSVFNYYELAHPEEGVASGFKYRNVPHITLKSIANNEPPVQETLYDQPYVDSKKVRVTGPFTVEAVPAPIVKSPEEIVAEVDGTIIQPADTSATRSGETLRQTEWRDELLKSGIRGKNGQHIFFSRVESLAGTRWLQADAETKTDSGQPERAVISFGPEHAPLEQRQVALALDEAISLKPQPRMVIFTTFQFDPEAAKDIDETKWPGVTLLKVQMNTDLLTDDLRKKRASNESFWLIGQPDVEIRQVVRGNDKGKWQVDLLGFDYYNTRSGRVESGGKEKIAMWMLDTDYDGRSLYPRQVFFPMAGEKDGWGKLARILKAEINGDLIEAYRGTTSLPFRCGKYQRVAVKIIDDRGIESLKILGVR